MSDKDQENSGTPGMEGLVPSVPPKTNRPPTKPSPPKPSDPPKK